MLVTRAPASGTTSSRAHCRASGKTCSHPPCRPVENVSQKVAAMVLRYFAAAAVAVALLLTGCVSASREDSSAQPDPGTQFGIPYTSDGADDVAHTLDLYPPTNHGSAHAPVIVWTGGNGFLDDTGANTAGAVAALFGPHGYAVAGVNIRSSSQATFPAQVEDLRAAIHFLMVNAERYRLDRTRVGVAGDSSGGWTALMVALTAKTATGATDASAASDRVGAVAAFYPPTDFWAIDRYLPADCAPNRPRYDVSTCQADPNSALSRVMGCALPSCPAGLRESATVTGFAAPEDPPVLLVHGSADDVVPWQQSAALFDAITAARGRAELILVPRGGHGQVSQWVAGGPLTTGATVTRTGDGKVEGPDAVALDGSVVVDFFDRALR